MQFIIATHSYLADGYKYSINFFDSSISNVHFINSYIDNQSNLTKELRDLLQEFESETVIILTDLPGGSVNKEAINFINEYHCQVISGINLSLVLELILSADEISEKTIRLAIKQAREQMVYMNDLLKGDG